MTPEEAKAQRQKATRASQPCSGPSAASARLSLFGDGGFGGERLDLGSSAARLGLYGFDSRSAAVEGGCCWEMYERAGFTGRMLRLCPGKYGEDIVVGGSGSGAARGIKSLRAVKYHSLG